MKKDYTRPTVGIVYAPSPSLLAGSQEQGRQYQVREYHTEADVTFFSGTEEDDN